MCCPPFDARSASGSARVNCPGAGVCAPAAIRVTPGGPTRNVCPLGEAMMDAKRTSSEPLAATFSKVQDSPHLPDMEGHAPPLGLARGDAAGCVAATITTAFTSTKSTARTASASGHAGPSPVARRLEEHLEPAARHAGPVDRCGTEAAHVGMVRGLGHHHPHARRAPDAGH